MKRKTFLLIFLSLITYACSSDITAEDREKAVFDAQKAASYIEISFPVDKVPQILCKAKDTDVNCQVRFPVSSFQITQEDVKMILEIERKWAVGLKHIISSPILVNGYTSDGVEVGWSGFSTAGPAIVTRQSIDLSQH